MRDTRSSVAKEPKISHLPDDVSAWPVAPHLVLGVHHDADKKEIRRAYARMIREYRPEEFPEEFNRLIDARDRLIQWLQFRNNGDATVDASITNTETVEAEVSPQDHPEIPDRGDQDLLNDSAALDRPSLNELGPTDGRASKSLDSIWEMACEGNTQSAYDELQAIVSSQPNAALRLYWLERLDASLSRRSGTKPRDWLIDYGLHLDPDVVITLLTEETAADESLLFREEFATWLGSPDHANRLLSMRWIVAARSSRPDILAADLDQILGSLSSETTHWCLIMLWAISLSYDRPMFQLRERCFEELQQADWFSHWTPVGNGEEIYEQAVEFHEQSATGIDTDSQWLRRILLHLPVHPVLRAEKLEEDLGTWWSQPDFVLARLRKTIESKPMLCHRFYRVLLENTTYDDRRLSAAVRLARPLFLSSSSYSSIREKVASLCRTFLVPSEWISRQLAYSSENAPESYHYARAELEADQALNMLSAAWCVHAIPSEIDLRDLSKRGSSND